MKKATTTNQAKANHKQHVLNTLNTGDINVLKMLPTVGMKTAYQIMTYR